MKKNIKTVYDLVAELEDFFSNKFKSEIWVYTRKSGLGSLLIKNSGNNKIIILKPSDSINAIGGSRIDKFISNTPSFKGHNIDNFIYIAKDFKDNAKRLAKVNKQLSLISVDFEANELTIFGSMNIDLNLLNILVEFSSHLKIAISYDFEGLLKHQGFDSKRNQPITQIEERANSPIVFFSYSWDTQDHKLWVLKLASDLIKNGIDVLIDVWDLDRYKNDLNFFMESGIREADKVIMICTPKYAKKANERSGGVGIENTIITGEFYDKTKSGKYITIAKNYSKNFTECLPSYVQSRYTIDFNNNEDYRNSFDELIRKILNVPRYQKPKLGKLPNLTSSEI
jgi:hypothetical protein